MKLAFALLALLVAGLGDAHAAPGTTNLSPANRILMVDPSSMPVGWGKATLTIGALHWAGGVYSGGYKIQVSPYFFKSEKGRLAIIVSDESLAEISRGMATAVIGTATTSGKGGIRRHIDAVVTPDDVQPRHPQGVVHGGGQKNDVQAGISFIRETGFGCGGVERRNKPRLQLSPR